MDATPEPIPRQVWAFWFGGPMQGARRASKNALEQTVGVPLVLVTDANLDKYVLKEHPLHPAFPNLTPVHKSVRAQAPGHRSMHSIGSNATPSTTGLPLGLLWSPLWRWIPRHQSAVRFLVAILRPLLAKEGVVQRIGVDLWIVRARQGWGGLP